MSISDADGTLWRDSGSVGAKLKETGTAHWLSPNTGATNTSGFTSLPNGFRIFDGGFNYTGNFAFFWTASGFDATNAWGRVQYYLLTGVYRQYYSKSYGFSVRCVMD
jgi:uncharacterized protein (TIGR02145 family)